MPDIVHATPLALFETRQMLEPASGHTDLTPATVTKLLPYKRMPATVRESPHLPAAVHLAEVMAIQIEERGWANYRQRAHTLGWITDMEMLMRLDGRTPEQIRRVLDWLDRRADDVADFWAPNILSPKKLRLRWGQMAAQYERLRRRQTYGKQGSLAEARGVDVASWINQARDA